MIILFLICCVIIFYTYLGYGLVLCVIVFFRRLLVAKRKPVTGDELPDITLLIAAYNEAGCIERKIQNSLALSYPAGKLHILVVADGSTDETPTIVGHYPQVQLMQQQPRAGKAAAINRGMQNIITPLVVFSDANALLNEASLLQLAQHFFDPAVGAVAGEKRVAATNAKGAAATEGIYWRYESKLKLLESESYSVMGAAGELFAIRTALFAPIPVNTLVDDLVISLGVAAQGYRVRYEPTAYTVEAPSANTREEFRRKRRMAAGGVQTFLRFKQLLLFRRPLLGFTFISHRVLRWLVAPYLLPLVFFVNLVLVCRPDAPALVQALFFCQLCWYVLALAGAVLDRQKRNAGLVYMPYYFCLMNYAMIAGMFRFAAEKQTVLWEKVQRADQT